MPRPRTPRRLAWSVSRDRLEQRLTPVIPMVGPWSPAQAELAGQLGVTAWTALAEVPAASPAQTPFTELARFQPLTLDTASFTARFADAPAEEQYPDLRQSPFVVAVPAPDGSFHRFRVVEVSIMEPALSAEFPDIKTYRGQGIDDPTASLAVDVTLHGFRASVLAVGGSWYVDPYYHLDQSLYAAYFRRDITAVHEFVCYTGTSGTGCGCDSCAMAAFNVSARHTESVFVGDWHAKPEPGGFGGGTGGSTGGGDFGPLTSNGTILRTYRAAIAGTGEYTAYHGGTVAAGQAAIVTSVNRINQIYERDLAVRLVLVGNNSSVVYTNASTDPYSNGNASTMLAQNQNTLDSVIGSANYDIGHVYGTGGGGVAGGLGIVGVAGLKGQGVSLSNAPVNDPFVIDYVAHEMGHQFNARHSFSSCGGSAGDSAIYAFEPGSGATIMAYAGLCNSNENLQSLSDAMFHSSNLDQIVGFITTSGTGQGNTKTATGNSIPVVSGGPNYTIPASTPFFLTASASDADGDTLTYSWEQRNPAAGNVANPTNTAAGPIFRAFLPTLSPTRFFPRLNNVLAGTVSVGETLPAVSRTLNFRVVVRDNRANGGAINDADVKVTVVDTGSKFQVTSPNTAVSWSGGSSQAITWDVAGTTGNGINAAKVDILLSTNGGTTWTTLLAGTPNDGNEVVTIPNTPTTTARIKVQASDNVFYDVSDKNFTIKAASAMRVDSTVPANGSLVASPLGAIDVKFTLPVNAATVDTNDLILSKGSVAQAQLLDASTVRYSLAGVGGEGEVVVSMPTGAVQSTTGVAVDSAQFQFVLDSDAAPFPTPLTPQSPSGSLVYTGTATGAIQFVGDTDAFTIPLSPDQTAVVRVTPASGLRPGVSLTGPGVNLSATAATAGQTVALPIANISGGTYTIQLSGASSSVGEYKVELELNAAAEVEPNDTIAAAQPLVSTAMSFGGATRYAVRGRTDLPGDQLPAEIEPNNNTGSANNASKNFLPFSGELFHLGLSGTINSGGDLDFFNLGKMQPGDVLTISLSGAKSSRGTLVDPYLQLVRNAGGSFVVVAEDDDSGPPVSGAADSLIYRWPIAVEDTYYAVAKAFGTTQTGTYQLGLLLENAGPAPLTGGIQVTEVEPNNNGASATNVSSSWRPAQFLSTTNGTISSTTDVDFYRFQWNSGDLVTLLAAPTGGSTLGARINLRTASGTVIALEDGSSIGPGKNSPIYAYRIPTTGTYFVDVASAADAGTYQLSAWLSASTLPPQGPVPFDIYSVPVAAGQTVEAALSGSGTTVEIVNAGGTVLATGTKAGGHDGLASHVASTADTYYVRVGTAATTEYRLAVVTGAAWEREPNNSFATGQPLSDGRAIGVQSGDDDWYRFTANAGQVVTLTTATPGSAPGEFSNNLDPVIELYSPTGILLTSDDNSAGDGKNAKLTWAATESGQYGVRVRGVAGSQGEYLLSAALTDNDPPPVVTAVTVNGGAIQRSRVTSIELTFSEPVTLPTDAASAFQLLRTGPGMPTAAVDLAVTQAGGSVTLTFTGPLTDSTSLIDGNFTLTVFAAKVTDSIGQPLSGGNFTTTVSRLFGDADGNGAVNFADFLLFRTNFGLTAVPGNLFDFDNNGSVDFVDFLAFRSRFGTSLTP